MPTDAAPEAQIDLEALDRLARSAEWIEERFEDCFIDHGDFADIHEWPDGKIAEVLTSASTQLRTFRAHSETITGLRNTILRLVGKIERDQVERAREAMCQALIPHYNTPLGKIEVGAFRDAMRAALQAFVNGREAEEETDAKDAARYRAEIAALGDVILRLVGERDEAVAALTRIKTYPTRGLGDTPLIFVSTYREALNAVKRIAANALTDGRSQ
jgi:hypothetical protein